jgi:hypothetical protein
MTGDGDGDGDGDWDYCVYLAAQFLVNGWRPIPPVSLQLKRRLLSFKYLY